MFDVQELDGSVTVSQGDTGSWEIEAQRDDGEDWTADDLAVMSICMGDDVILERTYRLDNPEQDETLANGVIRVELSNADTSAIPPGSYTWEMRYIIGAYTDGEEIVSGDGIDTPGMDGKGDPMSFTVKPVQRKIGRN